MTDMLRRLRNLLHSAEGQGMVEYGLIIGLVSVVLLGVLFLFGGSLGNYFTNIASALPTAS